MGSSNPEISVINGYDKAESIGDCMSSEKDIKESNIDPLDVYDNQEYYTTNLWNDKPKKYYLDSSSEDYSQSEDNEDDDIISKKLEEAIYVRNQELKLLNNSKVFNDDYFSLTGNENGIEVKIESQIALDSLLNNISQSNENLNRVNISNEYLSETLTKIENVVNDAILEALPALSRLQTNSISLTDKCKEFLNFQLKLAVWGSVLINALITTDDASLTPILSNYAKALKKYINLRSKTAEETEWRALRSVLKPLIDTPTTYADANQSAEESESYEWNPEQDSEETFDDQLSENTTYLYNDIEEDFFNENNKLLGLIDEPNNNVTDDSQDEIGETASKSNTSKKNTSKNDYTHGCITELSNVNSEKNDEPADTLSNEIVDNEVINIIRKKENKQSDKKRAIESSLKQKKQANLPQLPQKIEKPDDQRPVTSEIMTNVGLIRKRKKTEGNARVHNRIKYKKKLIKLSGTHMKSDGPKDSGDYEGENKGITIHVNRGRNIH